MTSAKYEREQRQEQGEADVLHHGRVDAVRTR
jgi:hypothetical protein